MIASFAALLASTRLAPRPLTFHVSQGKYRAEVRQAPRTKPGTTPRATAWGEFDSSKNVFVDSLFLFERGRPIDMPLSSFADLANVNEIRLKNIKDGCILFVVGGDAGVGYEATIWVRGKNVVQRTVRDGEFPENFYETTRYVSRAPNN